MALNLRPELIEFQMPTDPNFRAESSITQKIIPVSNIISGTGEISNNLEFLFTVPSGHRLDVSKSYILFDVIIWKNDTPTALTSTAPAINMCANFFSTGRLEVNDYLVSQSNNVSADDLFIKRILNSYTKNKSINSRALMWGTDTERFNLVQTVYQHQLAWKPDCLFQNDQVFPENTKIHLTLAVHPNLHTPTTSPAFVSYTNADGDGVLVFKNIYMVNTYVRVSVPTPQQVFLPAYSVKSTYQIASASDNNLQFTIPKETYKVAIALQSNASTVKAGLTNKFSSGSGIGGATQSVYSKLLKSLQLNYAGHTFPATQYLITEDTNQTGSVDAYMDYINATDGVFDPSGQESYTQWSDPKVLTDEGMGRIFLFNIIKPANSQDTNAELTISFSAPPTTTKVILFALTKTAIVIKYGAQKQIEEVASVPFA
jgi:hypothetical protein